ncbi:thioredoxin [Candidatus Dependentiae bacterium]|nr:MAG: thioredoxin [Candidatus Dependentiae bacterium]
MAVIDVVKENFEKEVLNSPLPVIVDVYASWCGPCQQMAPIFEELEKELRDSYKFVRLNVDEGRDLSIQYGISSVPTFIFIKDKEVRGKETGYMSKEDLKEKITKHLK